MGSIGPFQLLIIALVILILFGRGRISEMMGDFGKGVKSFRKGMADENGERAPAQPARIEPPADTPSQSEKTADQTDSKH